MIVLDASAAVEWLLVRDAAADVADRFRDPDVTVHAPSSLGVDVALAEVLEATLVTADARIASAPGLRARVAVVPTG